MELSLEQFNSKRKIQKCIWKEIAEGSVARGDRRGGDCKSGNREKYLRGIVEAELIVVSMYCGISKSD